METTTLTAAGPAKETFERPSCDLRWNGDTLEQRFDVFTSEKGVLQGCKSEWRPVEKITPTLSPNT